MTDAEKRETIASVVIHYVVRPGVKGSHTWDHSRLEPVWRDTGSGEGRGAGSLVGWPL
ncbi:hypothetical protein SAMN06272771_5012 [Streptomyces sp. Ag82_O1-12]|nr:hypothetical protein SAMN06272771_5012 [Streptomyces sp. Ag82_O1-12]SOD47597.1 hypothetical protein SAMN06272727_5013 [Streptomyces sp. Ag82_G6-1]